jgi:hypothetical protein
VYNVKSYFNIVEGNVTSDVNHRKIIMSGKPFVFVIDKNKLPLMPCTGKRARLLLERGRARVIKVKPFVIQLIDLDQKDCQLQEIEVKIDPGSITTGFCISRTINGIVNVLSLIELIHRGKQVTHTRHYSTPDYLKYLRAKSAANNERFVSATRQIIDCLSVDIVSWILSGKLPISI